MWGELVDAGANVAGGMVGSIIVSVEAKKNQWDKLSIAERNQVVKDIFDDAFSGKWGKNYRKQVEFNVLAFTTSTNGKRIRFNDLYEFFQTYPAYKNDYLQREIKYRNSQMIGGNDWLKWILGGILLMAIVAAFLLVRTKKK